jgi:hypothetical protein
MFLFLQSVLHVVTIFCLHDAIEIRTEIILYCQCLNALSSAKPTPYRANFALEHMSPTAILNSGRTLKTFMSVPPHAGLACWVPGCWSFAQTR